jgi:hypothetical protein
MSAETLFKALRGRGIRIEQPDGDTVVLRHLPIRGFNKPATNLLVARPGADLPFVALVDQDLEYLGSENAVKEALARAPVQGGWRPLGVDVSPELDVTIGRALGLMGVAWSPPYNQSLGRNQRIQKPQKPAPPPPAGKLLSRFSSVIPDDESQSVIGRQEQIDQTLSCLRRQDPCLPLIIGASGAGKTNLLRGVARAWSASSQTNILNVDLIGFIAAVPSHERAKCFGDLLNELIDSNTVAAIEHVELAAQEIHCGLLLLSQSLDRGAQLIATTIPKCLGYFTSEPLARRVHLVEMPALTRDELVAILVAKRQCYDIEIDALTAATALRASAGLPGDHPAKALSLLDAAAGRAAASGSTVLSPDDIYAAAEWMRPIPDPENAD